MSAADVARRWAEEISRHDVVGFAALYAPNAVVRDPQYPESLEGRDAIRTDMEEFLLGFPDLRAEVRSVFETADTYAAEGRFVGTHTGSLRTPSGEIPPTGRQIKLEGAIFCRLDAQGRILEENRYYDVSAVFAQLEGVS